MFGGDCIVLEEFFRARDRGGEEFLIHQLHSGFVKLLQVVMHLINELDELSLC